MEKGWHIMVSRRYAFVALVPVAASVACSQDVTVQLPQFDFTTVNTTVSVPDGGTALLGGIKRAATGSIDRGVPLLSKIPGVNRLFRNRGIGQERSSAMMHTRARIIILEELEREVMERARESRAARGDRRTFEELVAQDQVEAWQRAVEARQFHAEQLRAELLSRNIEHSRIAHTAAQDEPFVEVPDLEAVRRKNDAARQQRQAEALDLFERGKIAEQAGKQGAARVYYSMAMRCANGPLREEAAARLEILSGKRNTPAVSTGDR